MVVKISLVCVYFTTDSAVFYECFSILCMLCTHMIFEILVSIEVFFSQVTHIFLDMFLLLFQIISVVFQENLQHILLMFL